MAVLNPNQVNTSIFGMASAVFTSMCGVLVTTAIKGNILVDKTANTLIHGVSAAENVAKAVEDRSKIYGDGMVRNGELAERETTLKYKLRLANLSRQEEAVANGAAYSPEPEFADKLKEKLKEVASAMTESNVAHTEIPQGEPGTVKITSAVPIRA